MHLLQSVFQCDFRAERLSLLLWTALMPGIFVAADEAKITKTAFQILRDESRIEVREDSQPVLSFQFGPRELSGENSFRRSHYVHPLYGLGGKVITEDFPPDHLHHRGIFWAWHQVTVDGRSAGDAWLCRDFQWDSKFVEAADANGTAQIHATATWRSPAIVDTEGKPIAIATDHVSIFVHRRSEHQRAIDFVISLQALVPNVRIGGSDDAKGYGGFSTRLRMPDDLQFESASGLIVPPLLSVQADRWMLFRSDQFSYAILAHKDNPGEPNRWILRPQRSMQNAVFPGRQSVPISQDTATTLRYRLLIFDGQPRADTEVSQLLKNYDHSSRN